MDCALDHLIRPNWPPIEGVEVFTTTRMNGFSQGSFKSFNIADHVGDDAEVVRLNRQRLNEQINVPTCWMNQVHGEHIIDLDLPVQSQQADGALTSQPHQACAVMTADCLPIVFADPQAKAVGIVHAGWRGLKSALLDNMVGALQQKSIAIKDLQVWIGPCISQAHYEIDRTFKVSFAGWDETAFIPSDKANHWRADLPLLAKWKLSGLGIKKIYCSGLCTYADERFYSYRQDPRCGRMATIAYLKPAA